MLVCAPEFRTCGWRHPRYLLGIFPRPLFILNLQHPIKRGFAANCMQVSGSPAQSTVSWHIYQSISAKSHMNYTKLCQTFRSFSGASLLGLNLSNCNEKLGSGALEWRLRKMHPPVARTKIISIFCWRISPQALSSPFQDLEFQEWVLSQSWKLLHLYKKKMDLGAFATILDFCITVRPQQGLLSPSMTFLNPVLIFLLNCIERHPVWMWCMAVFTPLGQNSAANGLGNCRPGWSWTIWSVSLVSRLAL